MPIHPGLVSITFRTLPPAEVVRLAVEAELEGIEWGGDVHVPHGDVAAAREVARVTRDAGLTVAAYGSYYRAGRDASPSFAQVLDSARSLGAPLIRVWAGEAGSDATNAEGRKRVADDCRRIAALAEAAGITVVTEWHGGTLTDTAESAAALFAAVNHPGFLTYWQPRARGAHESCLRELRQCLALLAGVHVFQWHPETAERQPLAAGEAVWRAYLATAADAGDFYALLEFVMNDDPAQLARDAATLRRLLPAADTDGDAEDGADERRRR